MPLVLVLVLAVGCASGGGVEAVGEPVSAGSRDSYFVRVVPQESDGSRLVVDEVTFADAEGYAVVYADGGGAPGVVLGHSGLLPVGESRDVEVVLDEPLTGSGDVWVMLHVEDNDNDRFEHPVADPPAQHGAGIVVVRVGLVVA